MSAYAPCPLRVGQRFRLHHGGPVLVVERVTPCAAYVRSTERRAVYIPAKVDGEGREMTAARQFEAQATQLVAISLYSQVEDAEP